MVLLGKSLSGGFMPISCVLADNEIMDNIKPGDHGSTFGGNPLAGVIGIEALNVVVDENLIENSRKMGKILLKSLQEIAASKDFVKAVRGKGLFCVAEILNDEKNDALKVTMKLMEKGLLAKPTHDNIIRLCPPLVINEKQLRESIAIIKEVFDSF